MNSSQAFFDTVVLKFGTDVIATPDGKLNTSVMQELAGQIATLRQQVSRILVVTSGAVAAGRGVLKRAKRSRETIPEKQKYAAVGQVPLMAQWAAFLEEHGIVAAQGLLTGKTFDSKSDCLHLAEGLLEIFADSTPIIPIFNENDLIATRELKLTDNDELAALLAEVVGAQRVLLLSKIPGILRDLGDPTSVIREVQPGSRECEQYVKEVTSENGTGGAASKVRVGQNLSRIGIETTVAYGRETDVILRILRNQNPEGLGTTFLPMHAAVS